jgi:glycosyltransferase involved in cell wall biosynthesis
VRGPPDIEARGGPALLVVRNTFEHDARVLRAARTLVDLGHEVTVLAVRGTGRAPQIENRDGVRVIRVGPASTLARRAYGLVNRVLASQAGAVTGGPATVAAANPTLERHAPSPARSLAGRLVRWVTAADFYLRGTRLVLRLRPRIVQCNDYNTMWIGVAAKILCRSAVIYDSHELWPDRNLRPEARWWLVLCEWLFVRVADRVVMSSPAHAEVVARRYRVPEPVVVRNIPAQASAPPEDAPLNRGERERADGAVAVYVGGVLRHRGIEESIRALARAHGVRLRLLGPVEPAYREELLRLARAEGVEERVEFAAPVPPGEVVATLAEADVGLALFQPTCLSHRLVLPNKLFEYVLAGLPVVGSDLPMIARFVEEHGVGAAVDPGDADAIARALEETLRPEHNRELRAAARRARASIDWRDESEVLAGVYREALAA